MVAANRSFQTSQVCHRESQSVVAAIIASLTVQSSALCIVVILTVYSYKQEVKKYRPLTKTFLDLRLPAQFRSDLLRTSLFPWSTVTLVKELIIRNRSDAGRRDTKPSTWITFRQVATPSLVTALIHQQRLKGAIDTRIAEEQARQRQAAQSAIPGRVPPRRRPQAPNGNSPRVSSRQREQLPLPTGREPDPSEFEPEFAIGDDDSAVPSRVATPKPEKDIQETVNVTDTQQDGTDADQKPAAVEASVANGTAPAQDQMPEIPLDIQTKLKKLDRLETKYGELLKAYRIAHARTQAIDSFEAKLRENTPLTSIGDPTAFVEYLNQTTTKSDMILEEFRRVSAERDEYKKKAEESDTTITELRQRISDSENKHEEEAHQVVAKPPTAEVDQPPTTVDSNSTTNAKAPTSPTASLKSPASASSRIPSFSLFSPRSKPVSPPPKEAAEDLFSYDSEVPKLEAELEQRQTEVYNLREQMEKLKKDLVVARESTEGMVTSLESATRELHELRDAKDKFDDIKTNLEDRIGELEASAASDTNRQKDQDREMGELLTAKNNVTVELDKLKATVEDLESVKAGLQTSLESARSETNILNEKLGQKDSTVKDLEDSLAMERSAARQGEKTRKDALAIDEKLSTLQSTAASLRSQLGTAEGTINQLREEISANEVKFASRPSSKIFGFLDQGSVGEVDHLASETDVRDFLAARFSLEKVDRSEKPAISTATEAEPVQAQAQASKKKNKKKKKGKGGKSTVEEPEVDGSAGIDEEAAPEPSSSASTAISKLEAEIQTLKDEISKKTTTIEELNEKVKEQESMKEEIETLRDDLLHQGEEHVEAREALKSAQEEKNSLASKIDELEREMLETRKNIDQSTESDAVHKKTLDDLEQLRVSFNSLETDLKAAEQLAAARFKDLTELKDVLSKAQPELKSLRAEVADLKTAKDDLKNKSGELSRLEARHEDQKAEMKSIGKRLSEKDAEVKELKQKVEQETARRTTVEDNLSQAQSDVKSIESKRQDLVESLNKATEDLRQSREEASQLRIRLDSLEEQVSSHGREVSGLRDEITLKTALHSSSQALVQSLRDQTHELTTQAREATTKVENLEEELAEAQRMLSERTREGQTMRMLLSQSETGTESRIREMKERMDAAIEDRDRIEDEASVNSRRTVRELDDAKSKMRDAQRALRLAEGDREELELKQKEWKRRTEELEHASERATKESEDVRSAMASLREALTENERQLQEMETQKADLRKVGEEAKERIERLTKANKNLTEEVKALQTGTKRPGNRPGLESGLQSSRTSLDSARAMSPTPITRPKEQLSTTTSRSDTPTGLSQGSVDYVYLKNVLLQFLEQKDKAHQRQLIPVIGMLLHFDKKDEQKWMSTIATR